MTLGTTFLTHSPLKRMYNRPCRPTRVAPLVTPSVLTVEDNFVSLFVQEEKILQTMPEWAQFNQVDRRKVQTPWNVDPKILTKILFHYPPALPSTKSYDPKSFSIEVLHQNKKA